MDRQLRRLPGAGQLIKAAGPATGVPRGPGAAGANHPQGEMPPAR